MNYFLWLQTLVTFGTAVAESQGKDTRAVRYLNLTASLGAATVATNEDLRELREKYEAEVANDTPTEASELDSIAARIKARSQAIQASGS